MKIKLCLVYYMASLHSPVHTKTLWFLKCLSLANLNHIYNYQVLVFKDWIYRVVDFVKNNCINNSLSCNFVVLEWNFIVMYIKMANKLKVLLNIVKERYAKSVCFPFWLQNTTKHGHLGFFTAILDKKIINVKHFENSKKATL